MVHMGGLVVGLHCTLFIPRGSGFRVYMYRILGLGGKRLGAEALGFMLRLGGNRIAFDKRVLSLVRILSG
jgi:hypothetical protein